MSQFAEDLEPGINLVTRQGLQAFGAKALVTQRTQIPDGSLVLGSPAKVVRALGAKEIEELKKACNKQRKLIEKLWYYCGPGKDEAAESFYKNVAEAKKTTK